MYYNKYKIKKGIMDLEQLQFEKKYFNSTVSQLKKEFKDFLNGKDFPVPTIQELIELSNNTEGGGILPIFSFSTESSSNEIYECQVYIAMNIFNPITILGDENSDFCSVVLSFNGLKFKESFPIIEGNGRNFPEAFEDMLIRFKETQESMEE